MHVTFPLLNAAAQKKSQCVLHQPRFEGTQVQQFNQLFDKLEPLVKDFQAKPGDQQELTLDGKQYRARRKLESSSTYRSTKSYVYSLARDDGKVAIETTFAHHYPQNYDCTPFVSYKNTETNQNISTSDRNTVSRAINLLSGLFAVPLSL